MRLEQKVAMVTGASSGFGRATAERFAREGAKVVVADLDEPGGKETCHRIAAAGGDAELAVGDISTLAAAQRAVECAVARFGGLDVLVNNAGVGVGQPIAELPHDEWDRIVGTNLTGVYNVCRAAIPHLVERGRGWIVNISSLASKNPFVGGAAYCASKAGLNAFSEALMQELRPHDIRVSYVMPGSVATEFGGNDPEAGEDWKLHAEDVAQVVVDLLHFAPRALPSRVEIRPSRPKKG